MATGAGRERDVLDTFVELADTLASDYDVGEFLQFLVERCAAILGADVAGVLLETPGGDLTISAATSDDMRAIEKIEMSAGSGPCIDAYRSGESIIVHDVEEVRNRWPDIVPALIDMGMRSGYAFPMALRNDHIGALNLYRHAPGGFDDEAIRIAQAFADIAAIGILQERKVIERDKRVVQLQHALESRINVEQAKGVLVSRHGITPKEAFEALRRYARRERIRIHDLSERVVEGFDVPLT